MRNLILILGVAVTSAPFSNHSVAVEAKTPITVYKTPTCGCCTKWEDHLRANGFEVKSVVQDDLRPIKTKHGVPDQLASCHTAEVGSYAVEGHVPAKSIRRLLKERPKNTAGLAVPGMPIGSPGMEMGTRKDPYSVMRFDRKGTAAVYDRY